MKYMCPSMMCANYDALVDDVKALDKAGVDIFHCDIMDGTFVANMTMGMLDIRTIRKHTNKLVDVHLMIDNPANKVDWFIEAGVDIVYIHPESERYTLKTLQYIKSKGVHPGIAINPDTSISTVEELFPYCDYVMIMTVNPGFAGQTFIPSMLDKIKKLVLLKENHGFYLMMDGSCSEEKVKDMSMLGVDGFILGTSALFGKSESYKTILTRLKGE